MAQKPVQHYRYNADVLTLTKEDEAYFVTHFRPDEELTMTHWLNYHSVEDRESIIRLCDHLGIDKLIQEDIFNGTKRPRLEEYDGYVFFSIISALPTDDLSFDLKKERISFILGDNYLISFQERVSDHFPEVRDRLEMKKGKIWFKGPDFLLFRMLGAIIDNYMEVLEEIAALIEGLEDLVTNSPQSDTLRKIEWQKRKLVELRKIVQPMKELVLQLERTDCEMFENANRRYFLELKDSCLGIVEEIDAQKQILEGLANLYYAAQGQKMNEIMKVLTVISVIFIPLTFIAGVYGMNFKYMPELNTSNGYFYAIGGMALLAVILIFVFIRRGWLKGNS